MNRSFDELVAAAREQRTREDSLVSMISALKAKVGETTAGKLSEEDQAKVDEAFDLITGNADAVEEALNENVESEASAEDEEFA